MSNKVIINVNSKHIWRLNRGSYYIMLSVMYLKSKDPGLKASSDIY